MPSEFWEMTPYELTIYVEAFTDKLKFEAKERITQSWMTAAFYRSKKMPKLEKLLKDMDGKQAQTPEDMLEVVKRLNAKFGGTVVKQ